LVEGNLGMADGRRAFSLWHLTSVEAGVSTWMAATKSHWHAGNKRGRGRRGACAPLSRRTVARLRGRNVVALTAAGQQQPGHRGSCGLIILGGSQGLLSCNRELKAVHLKLDELIFSAKHARNDLIHIECLTEEQLNLLGERYSRLAAMHQKSQKRSMAEAMAVGEVTDQVPQAQR
jgi:hypothetical protein